MAKERISEFLEMSIETSKTEIQTENNLKDEIEYPTTVGQLQKV